MNKMKFEEINSKEELEEFFQDRGFLVQDYDSLIKIDESNFMKFEILNELDNEIISQKHREFKKSFKAEIQYSLLVNKEFTRFIFLRDYGTPIKFSFDKAKNYARETELALSKKLNSLSFSEEDFNESINNLFDVKEIVNKFYTEYRTIKNKLAKSIKNLIGDQFNYAQVILDRFIFIYFLQTKGILNKFYLSELYYNKKKKENFYKDYLKILFFQCLNKEQKNPDTPRIINGINFGKIPYLNGGLFSEKNFELDSPNIDIRDKIWDDIFSLFNKYEWVIEEEQGDSTTLTPSILGHIFEKSMTEDVQKGTGSYYTPEEITTYISKNTIYPLLQDKIKNKFKVNIKNLFKDLLDKDNLSIKETEIVRFLYEEVKNISILDNACGSGAFLIAAQQILRPIYSRCIFILKNKSFFKKEMNEIQKHKSFTYYIKRTIITNNLYGVDIQEGAVDIAKLRLWLSMVSEMNLDYKKIEPLPNIDYNILCGNSLIGFTKIIKTGGLQEHFELDIKESINGLKFAFPSTAKELEDLSKESNINNLIKIKEILVDLFRKEKSSITSKILKEVLVNIDEKLQEKLDLLYLNYINSKLKKTISLDELKKLTPFHWIVSFHEIINKGDCGFDIIIGNPPYGNVLRDIEKIVIEKVESFFSIKTDTKGKGTNNTASLFIERSYFLLKNRSNLGYIVPNSITRVQEFEKSRNFILENTHIYQIIDEGAPFEGVTLEMITLFFKKEKLDDYKIRVISKKRRQKNEGSKISYQKENRYVLYEDNIFHYLMNKGKRINFYDKEITVKNKESILSAKSLRKRWLLDLDRSNLEVSTMNVNNELYNKKTLLYGTKVFELRLNYKPKNIGCRNNVKALFSNEMGLEEDYLIFLFNSKLLNYYFIRYILNYASLTIRITPYYLEFLPIIIPINQKKYSSLVEFILNLARIEDENDKKDYIENILNCLVYELYFKPELKTHLTDMILPLIKDISKIESKEERIIIIKDFIKRTKNLEMQEEIKKIKNHEWVKIIENNSKI